jgi:hypothetical protein
MIEFIYKKETFIIINFFTLYYAIYLRSLHENKSYNLRFNRGDELIINMTIIGIIFSIISFIFQNYVFVEISHIILAFQIFFGGFLYSHHLLSYVFVFTIVYLLIVRHQYKKCPYYHYFPNVDDDILVTSYKFNNMCFILVLALVFAKKYSNAEI